jgi:hypothetical protein
MVVIAPRLSAGSGRTGRSGWPGAWRATGHAPAHPDKFPTVWEAALHYEVGYVLSASIKSHIWRAHREHLDYDLSNRRGVWRRCGGAFRRVGTRVSAARPGDRAASRTASSRLRAKAAAVSDLVATPVCAPPRRPCRSAARSSATTCAEHAYVSNWVSLTPYHEPSYRPSSSPRRRLCHRSRLDSDPSRDIQNARQRRSNQGSLRKTTAEKVLCASLFLQNRGEQISGTRIRGEPD